MSSLAGYNSSCYRPVGGIENYLLAFGEIRYYSFKFFVQEAKHRTIGIDTEARRFGSAAV